MKVLIAGESWIVNSVHIKGFDQFTTSTYGDGVKWLKEALISAGIEVDFIPNHLAPTDFPFTKEELGKYNVVILSDIGSNTLLLSPDTFEESVKTNNRLTAIKEYVAVGGGFAMIGGYMTFQGIDGKGRYKDTEIEEILPITMLPWDDRVETPQGVKIEIIKPDHPILHGISEEWPAFLGYNKLKEKDKESVLAKCSDDVFIAAWDYAEGRTMAFASDCAPHWGPPEFLNWEHYDRFWVNAVKWLAKK